MQRTSRWGFLHFHLLIHLLLPLLQLPHLLEVVTEALERVMEGRTILVIAHRLSTVRNADEILVRPGLVLVTVTAVVLALVLVLVLVLVTVATCGAGSGFCAVVWLVQVMREGEVVERGSHLQLLELGGAYRRLVAHQMEGRS